MTLSMSSDNSADEYLLGEATIHSQASKSIHGQDAPPSPVPLSPEEETMLRALGRVISRLARALHVDMIRERHRAMPQYTPLQVRGARPTAADERAHCRLQ